MLTCYDCRLPYQGPHWVECVVSDEIWRKIAPDAIKEYGGVLCINCMARRCVEKGLFSYDREPFTQIEAKITAGPFKIIPEEQKFG